MKMKEVYVSAPGKVILFGEHSVVYNGEAIAACLSTSRVHVRINTTTKENDNICRIHWKALNWKWNIEMKKLREMVHLSSMNKEGLVGNDVETIKKTVALEGEQLKTALPLLFLCCAILKKHLNDIPGLVMEIWTEGLPVGSGLGSSAAYSVAVATAFLSYIDGITVEEKTEIDGDRPVLKSLECINAWAFQAERLLQGNPSGVDNTVSTFGGAVSFRRWPQVQCIPLVTVTKIELMVTPTGITRSSAVLLQRVKEQYDNDTEIITSLFQTIACISSKARESLENDDTNAMEKKIESCWPRWMELNHVLLTALQVSHPAIEEIRNITATFDLITKLTGAGGGGCTITILARTFTRREELKQALMQAGYHPLFTTVGGPGVLIHSPSD